MEHQDIWRGQSLVRMTLGWYWTETTTVQLRTEQNYLGTSLLSRYHRPAPKEMVSLRSAEYDKTVNGGNADGVISSLDSIFTSLRLWQDINHNGISESPELNPLSALGLMAIELDYKASPKVDQYGNSFRYRAKVTNTQGVRVGRWAWDVFLVSTP
jgi:hypothetical protein